MKWAIRAKRVYDGTPNAMQSDGVVLIDGDRIAAVGAADAVALPPGTEVMDVGDRTVMPGLIDAHVHILFTGSERSGEESRAATDSEVLLTGVRNAQDGLRSGLYPVRRTKTAFEFPIRPRAVVEE